MRRRTVRSSKSEFYLRDGLVDIAWLFAAGASVCMSALVARINEAIAKAG